MKSQLRIKPGAEGNIHVGSVDVSADDFTPENTRVAISIKIPGDVLKRLREMAAGESIGYQTLINRLLRDAVSDQFSFETRLSRVEQQLAQLQR